MVVSVFGSSLAGNDSPEYAIAYEIGKGFAGLGLTICNGGYGGTMEAAARGAKEAGGHTIGVTIATSRSRNANPWIDEVITEKDLVTRLMKLIALGDGFVVLKGGTGTFLELAAVWEFMSKGVIPRKPCVVWGSFWHPVIRSMQEELTREGTPQAAQLITEAHTAQECVEQLATALGAR